MNTSHITRGVELRRKPSGHVHTVDYKHKTRSGTFLVIMLCGLEEIPSGLTDDYPRDAARCPRCRPKEQE